MRSSIKLKHKKSARAVSNPHRRGGIVDATAAADSSRGAVPLRSAMFDRESCTLIWTGHQRAMRGELLSAHQY